MKGRSGRNRNGKKSQKGRGGEVCEGGREGGKGGREIGKERNREGKWEVQV